MNQEYNRRILELVENNIGCYRVLIQVKKENKHLYDYIMDETKDFDDIKLSSRIYMVLTGQKSFPKCVVCGKELKHDIPCHPIEGFLRKTCSHKCAQLNPETRRKITETSIVKYGVEHPQCSSVVKNKMKQTLKSKTKEQTELSNLKRTRTCTLKYGVSNVQQNKDIHEKSVSSFSVRSEQDRKTSLEKRRNTNLKKYGSENYVNIKKMLDTRNCRSEQEKKQTEQKRRTTCMRKYGVEFACVLEKAKTSANIRRREEYYDNYIKDYNLAEPLFSKDDFVCCSDEKFKWKCRKCGNVFTSVPHEHQSHVARCEKCFPLNSSISQKEKELVDFIRKHYSGKVETNVRNIISPQEIDIYIPEKKLAIEFDGLYWHSDEVCNDKLYHIKKTNACMSLGIRMIHVFENEWDLKRNIVESRILALLNVFNEREYARKCTVKEISQQESFSFQSKNHLQDGVFSKVNLGLFRNDELISVMTFSKSRMDKNHQYELVRFCSKLGMNVVGGAGKLFSFFIRKYSPESIVTYADMRWSVGELYHKLGFTKSHESKPNYWYFKRGSNKLESRMKYQKHRQKSSLSFFDETLSECENMKKNDFLRIFDCGNIVFTYRKKQDS